MFTERNRGLATSEDIEEVFEQIDRVNPDLAIAPKKAKRPLKEEELIVVDDLTTFTVSREIAFQNETDIIEFAHIKTERRDPESGLKEQAVWTFAKHANERPPTVVRYTNFFHPTIPSKQEDRKNSLDFQKDHGLSLVSKEECQEMTRKLKVTFPKKLLFS